MTTPMTNDQIECLARVKDVIALIKNLDPPWIFEAETLPFLRALHSEIEKHGPSERRYVGGLIACKECTQDGRWEQFPCQTITDIKKELGI